MNRYKQKAQGTLTVAIVCIVVTAIVVGAGVYFLTPSGTTEEDMVPQSEYDSLQTQYNNLQDDYDELESDYNELKGQGLPDPIKIGVAYPQTGGLAPITKKITEGAKLAVKQINETGGIAGREVELVIEDTAAEPEKGVTAVKKLVEVDGVKVIIGPATSKVALAISQYLNDKQIPFIAPSATTVKFTEEGGEYGFRTCPSDTLQTRAAADLIGEKGYTRVATMCRSGDYGIGMETGLKNALKDKYPNIEIVKSIRYSVEKKEFRSDLQAIKGANPDAVFFATMVTEGYAIFRQATEIGLTDIQAFGGEGMRDTAFFEDETTAEFFVNTNFMGTKPVSPTDSVTYKDFEESYKEFTGHDVALWADYMYDAACIAALAIARAGVYEGEAIKEAIPDTAAWYQGASGLKRMNEYGDPIAGDYSIWQVVENATGGAQYETVGEWTQAKGIILEQ